MTREKLAEDTLAFVDAVENSRIFVPVERDQRRRMERSRRRLIRSIVRVCQSLSEDQLCFVAEYLLVVTL